MQQALPPPRDAILEQLDRMLASETFAGAERSRALLKFLVEQTVANHVDRLKEYTLGSEALGRGDSFDPRTDPIVRAEASRLRDRLQKYYATKGVADTVLITLPKGSYVPQFEFRTASGGTLTDAGETGERRASTWVTRLVWFAIGVVAAGVVLGSALWVRERTRPEPEAGTFQYPMELASGSLWLGSDYGTDVTLSPDGSRIVFVVRDRDGQLRLVTRRVKEFGESTARDLPGTSGSRLPFWSPDGGWVGFWADGKIKKTAVDGGKPVVVADAADFGGASWVGDHFIAVVGQSVVRVPASPGPTSVIKNLQPEGVHPKWPDVLPGGRHVLITAIGPPGATNIEAVSLTDGQRTVLVNGTFGRYRDGHLLYMNQGTLFAIPFDVDRLSKRGTAVPVLTDVSYASTFGFAQLDIARNGTLVYQRSRAQAPRVISWIDRAGQVEPFFHRPDSYLFPRLLPGGRRAYVAITDSGVGQAGAVGGSGTTISVLDPASDRMTRLSSVPGSLSGVWTDDGHFLVMGSMKGLHWARTDEPSHVEPLTGAATIQVAWSFSRDGILAYHEFNPTTAFDLWTVRITKSAGKLSAGKPELFLRTSSHETYPSISPDRRWMLYGSGQYGPWEVYVRPFPKTDGEATKVSEGGGRIPQWLNSRELVYRTDDHRLMIVAYSEKNGAFVPGKPREWTSTRLADTGVINNFDVHPEGTRMLGLLPADPYADRHTRNSITVVVNFSAEVRRLLSGH